MPISIMSRPLHRSTAMQASSHTQKGNVRRAALVLTVAMALSIPVTALAQDAGTAGGAQPNTLETERQLLSSPPVEGGTDAASQPISTPEQAAPAPAPADGQTERLRPAQPDAGTGTATERQAPGEPDLSFLEDPAGAISHLMTQAERDPNLPHDLSPWGMFMMADWVVKGVMILLVVASFAVWTVWLAKTIEIALAKLRARRAAAAIGRARNLDDASRALSRRGGPVAFMVRSAKEEVARSAVALDYAGNDGVKERLGARLARIEAQAGRRLSRGTGLLAIVGSTAPFVGLFGTVWGIMNSFIGISEAQTTNLAVVAPGIAEALLATAIGLVAAIPAVVIYNLFARAIAGYAQVLADAASGVEQLVSLELDLRKVPANDPGGPASQPVPSHGRAPAAAVAAE